MVVVAVLAPHLVCMNVASAGPLLCVLLDTWGGRHARDLQDAAQFVARAAVFMALGGLVLGMALGWLHWDAGYREAVHRFASRVQWGIVEFLFSMVLMAGYAIWLAARPQAGSAAKCVRSLVALIASTNLLYHFPPLFAILAGTVNGSFEIPAVVTSAEFRQLLVRGDIVAVSIHFALASIAVTGVLLIVYANRHRADEPGGGRVSMWGARAALLATLLQIPVGLWLLMQLPANIQRELLGGDLPASLMLLTSVLASIWLLHLLASVALGEGSSQAARRIAVVMLGVVVLMTGVLQRTKSDRLGAAGQVNTSTLRRSFMHGNGPRYDSGFAGSRDRENRGRVGI